MKLERSFGVIPLRRNVAGEWEVLIVQLYAGHWGFPKGHGEAGETPLETAVRELEEETGLQVKRFLTEELFVERYRYTRGGEAHEKEVGYLVGEVAGEVRVQGSEVREYAWVKWHEIEKALTFEELKALVGRVKSKRIGLS
jgi:bis(5'-nucleosidyl)-tetraphosphatase